MVLLIGESGDRDGASVDYLYLDECDGCLRYRLEESLYAWILYQAWHAYS